MGSGCDLFLFWFFFRFLLFYFLFSSLVELFDFFEGFDEGQCYDDEDENGGSNGWHDGIELGSEGTTHGDTGVKYHYDIEIYDGSVGEYGMFSSHS